MSDIDDMSAGVVRLEGKNITICGETLLQQYVLPLGMSGALHAAVIAKTAEEGLLERLETDHKRKQQRARTS